VPRFILNGKSTSLQVDEQGIWTSSNLFVPWGTVKAFKLISSPSQSDWLIYSPGLQWGYVTGQADQFTAYAEDFAGIVETAEVTRDQFGRVTAWDFSDGRRIEYSTKESMLVLHQGPYDQTPRVKNKRWIENWSVNQGFHLTDEVEKELTAGESALVGSVENQFTWGEFSKQEPLPPVSYLRVMLMIGAIVLGILFGIFTDS